MARINYQGIVKNKKIGQPAANNLLIEKDERSETIWGTTVMC